ncbi:M23 family metallopeptidase [Streptomyces sp. WAC05374]|uniref:M23 family metallopeptidase n=1 Tax=Streptomyces sp. WAC05374 TaxID=2487420 RepID=UPI000F87963A|nr:M23 family metallopeptidase [Streptomyces sp. WAC05374]RST13797.1 M23 family metallopeptidase [Streptomyces sp. WAC05374]TDF36136.1 M23 family metallopeptidase [Streptomyces sp. WAC05374]TDF45096.1 M23 family metallopeptidase [Streptomyces sp. WAC05374]TDF56501.1 M23 family metallopeptidase [Streptomyces sp. WAC05374]
MSVRTIAGLLVRVLWALFIAQVLASFLVDLPYDYWVGWLPLVAAVALRIVLNRTEQRPAAPAARDAVEVEPPVVGAWSALNSPADKVPSHGTHALGQTYAIDIVAESETRPRPAFAALWPVARRNRAFPAFGAPLLAAGDATVVHADDRLRDHLSRNSLPALPYFLLVEGVFRSLGGPRHIIGNHVVLDLGDGVYAMYAHLQRGSLRVRAGDRVTAGQPIARCGNSGNSTEPHLHFQLMDGPDPRTARGIPFTWRGVGVPAGGETFTVGAGAYSA